MATQTQQLAMPPDGGGSGPIRPTVMDRVSLIGLP
jgi:hypothetical protein